MIECEICKLNPKGIAFTPHCINIPVGQGCKGCENKCKNEAFYVGGLNICLEHKEAFYYRMQEIWAKKSMA